MPRTARRASARADTLGLLLAVAVTAASVSDNLIGAHLLDRATTTYLTLAKTSSAICHTHRCETG